MSAGRFHIIIDLSKVPSKILKNEAGLKDFLKKLTSVIDMNILYGPVVVNGIPQNPGLSGFVIIDYSHISIHTFTKSQEAQVDIFSCKTYEQKIAIDATLEYFQVAKDRAKMKIVQWE